MKCPICGTAELVHDTRDLTYTYKGETTTLPNVTGEFCPACNESVLDMEESRRVMDLMLALNQPNKLADLLSGVTDENKHSATDWGKPVGKEVLN